MHVKSISLDDAEGFSYMCCLYSSQRTCAVTEQIFSF